MTKRQRSKKSRGDSGVRDIAPKPLVSVGRQVAVDIISSSMFRRTLRRRSKSSPCNCCLVGIVSGKRFNSTALAILLTLHRGCGIDGMCYIFPTINGRDT